MDVRELRWFQQVADGVTLTELSDLEMVAQSGVSRALARLDAEVGTPLLERSGRTLRMTRAGATFKRHVDAAMHELDDGLAAVQQLIDPEWGVVRLAFQPSLGTWLVPALVRDFQQDHPGVGVELTAKHDELSPAVGRRSPVDLELTTRRFHEREVAWHLLVREPLRLAVPPRHPLAGRRRVELSAAADEPFVAIQPRAQALREVSQELCERAGFEPRVAFVCDDLPTMRAFVAGRLGVAILPVPPLPAPGLESVEHLELSDRRAFREVGLAWHAEHRMLPAAELFRDHVLRQAASGALTGPD